MACSLISLYTAYSLSYVRVGLTNVGERRADSSNLLDGQHLSRATTPLFFVLWRELKQSAHENFLCLNSLTIYCSVNAVTMDHFKSIRTFNFLITNATFRWLRAIIKYQYPKGSTDIVPLSPLSPLRIEPAWLIRHPEYLQASRSPSKVFPPSRGHRRVRHTRGPTERDSSSRQGPLHQLGISRPCSPIPWQWQPIQS